MSDLNSILGKFPLSKETENKVLDEVFKPEVRIFILTKLIDVLTGTAETQEEAAALFNQAKPLAKMFKEISTTNR